MVRPYYCSWPLDGKRGGEDSTLYKNDLAEEGEGGGWLADYAHGLQSFGEKNSQDGWIQAVTMNRNRIPSSRNCIDGNATF